MKAKLIRYGACFEIALEAETLAEGAQIADFGVNSTKELRSLTAFISDGGFALNAIVGMRSYRTRGSVIRGGGR